MTEVQNVGVETSNLILCQFETVNKTKKKQRVTLRYGLVTLNGKDYCFKSATGELNRW